MAERASQLCDDSQVGAAAEKTVGDQPCSTRRTRRRRWHRRLALLLLPCVLVVGIYAARQILLPPVARFLNVGERPSKVDYVMVLGGGADSRPFLAAAMYKVGLAKAVLVVRSKPGPDTEDGISPPEHEIIFRVLDHEGVPAESVILLEEECTSTQEEAKSLAAWLHHEPESRVAVVTTDYHTRRARRVFHHELGNLQDQVCFLGVPTRICNEENWWKSRDGFLTYLNELGKSGYYWLRY